jgi:hypothetical protein
MRRMYCPMRRYLSEHAAVVVFAVFLVGLAKADFQEGEYIPTSRRAQYQAVRCFPPLSIVCCHTLPGTHEQERYRRVSSRVSSSASFLVWGAEANALARSVGTALSTIRFGQSGEFWNSLQMNCDIDMNNSNVYMFISVIQLAAPRPTYNFQRCCLNPVPSRSQSPCPSRWTSSHKEGLLNTSFLFPSMVSLAHMCDLCLCAIYILMIELCSVIYVMNDTKLIGDCALS